MVNGDKHIFKDKIKKINTKNINYKCSSRKMYFINKNIKKNSKTNFIPNR